MNLVLISIIACSGLMVTFFLIYRNELVFKNHCIIIDAITCYRLSHLLSSDINKVCFEDMESYSTTLLRLTDFGYTNILPKDKYELVKPYIGEESNDSQNAKM